jgi:hypothetical protein
MTAASNPRPTHFSSELKYGVASRRMTASVARKPDTRDSLADGVADHGGWRGRINAGGAIFPTM